MTREIMKRIPNGIITPTALEANRFILFCH